MLSRMSLVGAVLVSLASSIVSTSETSWLGPEFALLTRVFSHCKDKDDFIGCLKQKALIVVSRAMNQDNIQIMDGVSFHKQNATTKTSILNDEETRALVNLPALDRALLLKVDRFLRTHTLVLNMGEGRGKDKDKKIHKYITAALITAMSIAGPIGLKAVAFIAVKALVIAKVALTVAAILALKKLFAKDSHEETSFQVHSADHNRRNTFVVRPIKATVPPTDPYRYYYEYPQQ